jgi:hypothetical protein
VFIPHKIHPSSRAYLYARLFLTADYIWGYESHQM